MLIRIHTPFNQLVDTAIDTIMTAVQGIITVLLGGLVGSTCLTHLQVVTAFGL